MIRERQVSVLSGGLMLLVLLAADAGLIAGVVHWVHHPLPAILCALGSIVVSICLAGLFIINPNEPKVLQLFGRYVGTVREPGLRWSNPFYTKKKISVGVRDLESNKRKVNDRDGSHIEIPAVVEWHVVDPAGDPLQEDYSE